MVDVLVKRLSESEDRIPVMISERLLDVTEDYEGEYIHVMGQFRSYNRHEEKKNRLVLSVFAREVEFVADDDENMKSNAIFLDGYICKPPVLPETSFRQRNRRSSDCSKPTLWEIRLHPLYLLGKKCPLCIGFSGGRSCVNLGKDSKQRIRKKNQRGRDREKNGI